MRRGFGQGAATLPTVFFQCHHLRRLATFTTTTADAPVLRHSSERRGCAAAPFQPPPVPLMLRAGRRMTAATAMVRTRSATRCCCWWNGAATGGGGGSSAMWVAARGYYGHSNTPKSTGTTIDKQSLGIPVPASGCSGSPRRASNHYIAGVPSSFKPATQEPVALRELQAEQPSVPEEEVEALPVPPSSSDVTIRETFELFARHMWPAGKPHLRRRVVLAFALLMLGKVFKVSVPLMFKRIIDQTTDPAMAEAATAVAGAAGPLTPATSFAVSVGALIFAYGLGKIVSAIFHEGAPAIFSPVGSAAANNVQLEVFMKLHSLDATFHKNRPIGIIVKEIERASKAFSNISRTMIFVLIPTAIELALVGVMLCQEVSLGYSVFAITVVLLYALFTVFMTNWRATFRRQYIKAENEVMSRLTDSLLNYNNVKYFQNEDYEARRIDDLNQVVNRKVWTLESTLALLNVGQQTIFALAVTCSLAWSTYCVSHGLLTVGGLVMIDSLLVQLYHPISSLGAVFRELDTGRTNLQATIALLRTPVKPMNVPDPPPFVFSGGEITFENVGFAYPDAAKRILNRCTFTIPKGKVVGIIGPSGCGKSTIFALLYRFFDPDEGRVLIDGQDIARIDLVSLRQHIGVIPQDTVVFNDTIMFNIRYARLDATDAEVIEAARSAKLHDTILQYPKGYDTELGEGGVRMSGGERQRLSIARVILRGSGIVLADEPTSAVDSSLDMHLMSCLRDYTRGDDKTLVVVAHRLHTVQDADVILVLSRRGAIAEVGNHDTLMDRDGLYARLWSEQHQATMRVIESD